MSRIIFHSPERDSEVAGAERFYLGGLCEDAFLTAADLRSENRVDEEREWIKPLLPKDLYFVTNPLPGRFCQDIETWARIGHISDASKAWILIDGEKQPLLNLQLNTALVIGGDALKLAARLNGQCEIYCYVEAHNRLWLAGIIEKALDDNIFREKLMRHPVINIKNRLWLMGWRDVIDHLRDGSSTPVVCSYSVCSSFPNPYLIPDFPETVSNQTPSGDEEDVDWDAWEKADQWGLCMDALRKMSAAGSWLELKPDDWQTFRFHGGKSGFDVRAQQWKLESH